MNPVDLVDVIPLTPSGRKKPTFRKPLGALEVVKFVQGPDLVKFTLPFQPPPLSACFVNVAKNGRADTARYKTWKTDTDAYLARSVSNILGTPYSATIKSKVAVYYIVRRPDNRKRDLDNLCKAINDTLARNHILKDDSQIVDLRIRWMNQTDAFYGEVQVEISKV